MSVNRAPPFPLGARQGDAVGSSGRRRGLELLCTLRRKRLQPHHRREVRVLKKTGRRNWLSRSRGMDGVTARDQPHKEPRQDRRRGSLFEARYQLELRRNQPSRRRRRGGGPLLPRYTHSTPLQRTANALQDDGKGAASVSTAEQRSTTRERSDRARAGQSSGRQPHRARTPWEPP